MKKGFKKGDRVAVYGFSRDGQNQPYNRGNKATVVSQYASDEMEVSFDKGTTSEVHPKQCRRLKKKAPKYIWISEITGAILHEAPDSSVKWKKYRMVK